ncbi:RluA family pseudouridine synthase [Cytobacillus spongiae]|uniref:RluA family pseudouridine synthase n=1 Tax=Cytobacillus spongiae TaxID=2901381 RepID=UPI001F3C8276|nr:RluA family pseudouridine synthase [Cytobacillus spongiae]UII56762.1 RluA family pseudouridine synthase [Cytobacillus spongiae]
MKTQVKGNRFDITLPMEWDGLTIENLLKEVWGAPKKHVHALRMDKAITVNGEFIPWKEPIKAGDTLQLRLFSDESFGVTPAYFPIDVLYEDEFVIVMNKPAHMDTHPNTKDQTDTLANAVAFHLQAKGENRQVQHIHRLDRDTTGAILFAKQPIAGAILDQMLENRVIKRTYVALVQGLLTKKKGTISTPIGRDRHHPTRRRTSPTGQEAITHFEVLNQDTKKQITLIKCMLDTGRTHQIRVHLSSLGHPLVGDLLYGGKLFTPRQALHAVKLEFLHPFTREKITCYAPFLDEPAIFSVDPYSI